MRMTRLLALTFAAGLLAPGLQAQEPVRAPTKPLPANYDWTGCKAEIAKFCAAEEKQGSEAIYACLFKHDSDQSKTCDPVHSKYEELTGRTVGPPKK